MYKFAGRFNRKELFIKEFNYWILMLRPVPVTIGSCIILLKRECFSITEVTKEEMTEFLTVCTYFENSCKNLYGAVKFNYHADMMKDSFVHFKAIPRYDKPVIRHGEQFIDKDWPLTEKLTKNKVSEEMLQKIKQDFLNNERENRISTS